jgi:hypothetical protein
MVLCSPQGGKKADTLRAIAKGLLAGNYFGVQHQPAHMPEHRKVGGAGKFERDAAASETLLEHFTATHEQRWG